MTETLTEIELDLVFFVERFHAQNGVAPTDDQINMRFTGITAEMLGSFKANPLVKKSFVARGIMYPPAVDVFTAKQMHAAGVMMDLLDRRSDEKKLREVGVTTRQWATWLQNDQFAGYLKERSEKLLENSVHEAHKGLLKGVRQGNLASVKQYYEITGRYRPNEEVQIDIRRVLHTFIEVIQRYVKDPILLHNISVDLANMASAESLSTGLSNQMMTNAQEYRQQTIQGSVQPSIPAPSPIEGLEE